MNMNDSSYQITVIDLTAEDRETKQDPEQVQTTVIDLTAEDRENKQDPEQVPALSEAKQEDDSVTIKSEAGTARSTAVKRKSEDDGGDCRKKACIGLKVEQVEAETGTVNTEEVDEEATVRDEDEEDISAEAKADAFDSLDDDTKKWLEALGLKDGYGTQRKGLAQIESLTKYEPPPNFERLFHLTDFLWPAHDGNETFHWRLFRRHKRPGIPVRKVLRDMKKNDPEDPLVSWHQPRKEWIPPTATILAGMIRLILDM